MVIGEPLDHHARNYLSPDYQGFQRRWVSLSARPSRRYPPSFVISEQRYIPTSQSVRILVLAVYLDVDKDTLQPKTSG